MFGDGTDDELLRSSWHEFCDELKKAGDLVFRDSAPKNAVGRAVGLRQLARNIGLALQLELDNADPEHPELFHYFDPIRKQGGDNTDALYLGGPVNGTDTYRVRGYRGSAKYFAVTVLENGNTPWGGQVVGTLIDDQLHVEQDGSFELVISPHEHPGNWIKSSPDTYRLTFRQFFADLLQTEVFSPELYFLSQLPADIESGETVSVILIALALSFLATLYPAWRAARLDPVEALRYE